MSNTVEAFAVVIVVPVSVLDLGITDSFSGVLISTAAGLKWASFGAMPVIAPVSFFFGLDHITLS